MVNLNKLKGKIVEKGYSMHTFSDCLSFDKSTFYRKMKNKGDTFSIKEATEISNLLGLSYEDMMSIFFADDVA